MNIPTAIATNDRAEEIIDQFTAGGDDLDSLCIVVELTDVIARTLAVPDGPYHAPEGDYDGSFHPQCDCEDCEVYRGEAARIVAAVIDAGFLSAEDFDVKIPGVGITHKPRADA